MKRRGFLQLLGLAPIAGALIKEALAAPAPPPVDLEPIDMGSIQVDWHAKYTTPELGTGDFTIDMVRRDGQWHLYTVTRQDGIERIYIDNQLYLTRPARGEPLAVIREMHNVDFTGYVDSPQMVRIPSSRLKAVKSPKQYGPVSHGLSRGGYPTRVS